MKMSNFKNWPVTNAASVGKCSFINFMSLGLRFRSLTPDECIALEWLMTAHTETPGWQNFGSLIKRGVTYADKIRPHIERLRAVFWGVHPTFNVAFANFVEYERRRLLGFLNYPGEV